MVKRADEVSLKTYRILITIISGFSLTINLFSIVDTSRVFLISLPYFASNLLTFYAINAKTTKMFNSREFVKRALLIVIVGLFLLSNLSDSILEGEYENYFCIAAKVICTSTIWFVFFIALRSDLYYSPEPQEITDLRNDIHKDMEEEKEKVVYRTRDSKVESNLSSRKFVEENDRKLRTERGTKK